MRYIVFMEAVVAKDEVKIDKDILITLVTLAQSCVDNNSSYQRCECKDGVVCWTCESREAVHRGFEIFLGPEHYTRKPWSKKL